MKWTNRHRQFDTIGNNFKNKDIIIYGAGPIARDLFSRIEFLGCVRAFVDRNEELRNEPICGIEVISVQELANIDRTNHIVIIAISGYSARMVMNQLLHLGYTLGKDCFHWETFYDHFLSVYSTYSKDQVYFPSISFLVTTLCNLNCRSCLNFTKLNKNKRHYNLEDLKQNADLFFSSVDYVDKFHMSGGEPFLYPHMAEIISYVYDNYGSRIWQIYTATNGTVIPSQELCSVLNRCNVFVEIDNYRKTLTKKQQKNDIIIKLFTEYGICHSDRGASYWIDLLPEQRINQDFDDTQLSIWYDTCNNPFSSIHDGKLYSCNYDDYSKEAGLATDDCRDYLDLRSMPPPSKKELLEFRHGYTPRGFVEFCKKCAGHEMINQFHCPVAEQI